MFAVLPEGAAYGIKMKPPNKSVKQRHFDVLDAELRLTYALPSKKFLSLEELSYLKAGRRRCPAKDDNAYKKHAAEYKKNTEDRRKNRKLKSYLATDSSPYELFMKLNAFFLSDNMVPLIKPGPMGCGRMFTTTWLSFVALKMDPENFTGTFWVGIAGMNPNNYVGTVANIQEKLENRLIDEYDFDTDRADEFATALSIFKLARSRDQVYYYKMMIQADDQKSSDMVDKRCQKFTNRLLNLAYRKYQKYKAKRIAAKQPVEDQEKYTRDFCDCFHAAYCAVPADFPITTAVWGVYFNAAMTLTTNDFASQHAILTSKMVYFDLVRLEDLKACGDTDDTLKAIKANVDALRVDYGSPTHWFKQLNYQELVLARSAVLNLEKRNMNEYLKFNVRPPLRKNDHRGVVSRGVRTVRRQTTNTIVAEQGG